MLKQSYLKITEIFYSLQGEANTVGIPTVFVRLTGCPLRCQYCDTAYAFYEGARREFDDILTQISQYRTRFVTVTGGEPLAQKQCLLFLTQLCDAGYEVSLETSGAVDICGVDQRVSIVLDLKTPGSGEMKRNLYDNIAELSQGDQVKFVICHHEDYLWTKNIIETYQLVNRCEVLLSPSHGQIPHQELANWILADQLAVRFQIQLHKYLWGDVPGR